MSLALLQLAGLFAMLSMLAFGGGAGVIPDMQRAAVDSTIGSPPANFWTCSRSPAPRRGRDR